MYRFPAIHVRTFPFARVSAMAKSGCLYFFQTYSPGGATIGSPICTGTLHQRTFSSFRSLSHVPFPLNFLWLRRGAEKSTEAADLDPFRVFFIEGTDVESVSGVDLAARRNQRRRVLLQVDLLPVDAFEVWMVF